MTRNQKLFRAIVVAGAAITAAPGCDVDADCGKCLPIDAQVATTTDAPTDAGPSDTPVDVVLIL